MVLERSTGEISRNLEGWMKCKTEAYEMFFMSSVMFRTSCVQVIALLRGEMRSSPTLKRLFIFRHGLKHVFRHRPWRLHWRQTAASKSCRRPRKDRLGKAMAVFG